MPRHSRSRPGSKPGVSTSVTIGRLNASHHAMKRAALRDASMSIVPARCAAWLRGHGHKPVESHTADYEHRNEHENSPPKGFFGRLFERWEAVIDAGIAGYTRLLGLVLGIWGLYSPKRALALFAMLLCCLAIGLGSYTGAKQLYVYYKNRQPLVDEYNPAP